MATKYEEWVLSGNLKEAFSKWEQSNKRWKNHWYDCCLEIYNGKVCRKSHKQKFIFDSESKTIVKRKFEIAEEQIFYNGCKEIENPNCDKELLYFIIMRDKDDKAIYYKVGTTTRKMESRMKEHLEYYEGEGVYKIEIDKVYDCGTIPAEGLESYIRAKMIKIHPNAFKKNDRFIADEVVKLDLEKIDKWIAEYLG